MRRVRNRQHRDQTEEDLGQSIDRTEQAGHAADYPTLRWYSKTCAADAGRPPGSGSRDQVGYSSGSVSNVTTYGFGFPRRNRREWR